MTRVATERLEAPRGARGARRPVTVLRPAAFTPTLLWRGVAALPRHGALIAALTRHRLAVRYRQSLLGPLWAVLQPLAMMLVLAAIFAMVVRAPSEGRPYALFAYAGLLPWTAFASAAGGAAVSLVAHASLVTRVSFPREVLPATYIAAALVDLAVASIVLVPLLLYYDVAIGWSLLWVLPVVALLAAFCLAVALVLCAVHVRFRDVGIAMPLLLQVWMFASPVIYSLDSVPDRWRGLYVLNPMAGIVDGFRRAVLDGTAPDPQAFGAALVVTTLAVPLAYLWFKHVEATMADVV